MTTGEKINKLRKEKGLTLYWLSQKSGLSEVTLCHYETDVRKPSALNIVKLAKALEMDYFQLYNYLLREK